MWPDWISNSGHLPLESDAQPTVLRVCVRVCVCVCVCVCVREREREGCLYSHVSGGKFSFEKNDSHFFLGQKLLHVRGKASIPFERLSKRLYLPTCIRKFCHAIQKSTTLEKMLLKYAAFRGRTLCGCLIKKRLETSKRTFSLATSSAEIVLGQNNGI